METVSFNIPSLGCSTCSNKVQSTLKSIAGVLDTSVDLKSQQLNVEYNPTEIQPEKIKKSISELGFDVF